MGPLLFTGGTGGGEIGVAGRAGVVGVTGVTGVGGMLESLRLSWLCSDGPPLRTFTGPSLLLDFCTHGREHTRRQQGGRDSSAPPPPSHQVTHHLGRRLGLLLEGFPGFGCSCLGLVDPLCGQEWAAELRKEGGLTESQGSVSLHSGVLPECQGGEGWGWDRTSGHPGLAGHRPNSSSLRSRCK